MKGIIISILNCLKKSTFESRKSYAVSRLFGGKETVFLLLLFILPFTASIVFSHHIFILGDGTKLNLLLSWPKSSFKLGTAFLLVFRLSFIVKSFPTKNLGDGVCIHLLP